MLFAAFGLALIVNMILQMLEKVVYRGLGHQIETKVRKKLVKNIMSKDMPWFDRQEN